MKFRFRTQNQKKMDKQKIAKMFGLTLEKLNDLLLPLYLEAKSKLTEDIVIEYLKGLGQNEIIT